MRKIVPIVFALTAVFAAAAASAADPTAAPSSRAEKRAEMRQEFFNKLDTNHDGVISRAEYQAWVDSRFAKLDTNGDGTVDADEVATSQAAMERVQKRAEGFVKRYDASGDGKVSKADFEAKEMQHFDRLSNGADSITEDQLAAARPPFKHRRVPQATTNSSDSGS